MSTPMQDFLETYRSQIDSLYQQLSEVRDEASYWRFAFAFLVGYSKAGTGKEFDSMKEYQKHILEMYEQGVSLSTKRGSK